MKRAMSRSRWIVVLLALATMLTACGNSRTPDTLSGAGSESARVAGVWWLAFGVGGAVYLIVAGLVVYGSLRKGDAQMPEGRRLRESVIIAVCGVAIPFLILVFFAVVTVNATAHLRKSAPSDAVHLVVTGKRWWWEVQYPKLGITTANEIRLPVGQPVYIELKSDNVIHSFWVPQLAGKEDMIPGQTNDISFTVKRAGVYIGECAEYCGVEHAKMQFRVIAMDPAAFTAWTANELQINPIPLTDQAAEGERLFMSVSCSGCHTIRGTQAQGQLGPDLTNVGGRITLAAGTLENTTKNMEAWIRDPQQIKPGNLMPNVHLSDSDRASITAYLEGLK